jgi:acyl carrier protein
MVYPQSVTQANFEDVKAVVVATLDLGDRADDLVPESHLLGNLPELDSLAVVELLTALQDRFGIEIEDDEVISDIFETLGQLTAFIDAKVRLSAPRRLLQPPGG